MIEPATRAGARGTVEVETVSEHFRGAPSEAAPRMLYLASLSTYAALEGAFRMTPEQAAAYKRFRTIPKEFAGRPRSEELLKKMFEARFKRRSELNARRRAAMRPAHEALRSAFHAIPGVAEAIKKTKLPEKIPQAVPTPRAQRDPLVRLGSLHIVDVPPFQALTGQSGTGNNVISGSNTANPVADGNAGVMNLLIGPGTDDSGNCECWCALGQAFVTPDAGILQFSANPSYCWTCVWMSQWWRQAAGTAYIGQVINRWAPSGAYLDTPVSTQNTLYSFDDYNFDDDGYQTGEASGDYLTSQITCAGGEFIECWVVIGAYANADGTNSQSSALVEVQAALSSITIDWMDFPHG